MSNNETTTRVITVRLRIPALVVAAVLLIGGLIWSFVLGIMVGRGQINDELASLMPENNQTLLAQYEADKASAEIEELIKAEDLKFQESLRQNQPDAGNAQASPDSASNAASANVTAPEGRVQATTASTTPAARTQASANLNAAALAEAARRDSGQNSSAAVAQPASSTQQYQYLYQVASYSKEAQAKDLQSRLQAKGLAAQLETSEVKGQPMFRVLISFKGNAEAVTQLQNMLKKDFKINSILQRSRTSLAG